MTVEIFDARACTLGEGPLWHPERNQLFWFDILERKLMTRSPDGPKEWQFEEPVSAAGWICEHRLFMASARGLWQFDMEKNHREIVCALEEDNSVTRSNDGRADPWGGFWIGTMGYSAEPGAGAIYRYYGGALRKLFPGITIPNAMCFAPDRSRAYFADTATRQVMQVPLNDDGWPSADPEVFVDLRDEGLNPDGALVDASGVIWVAQWGAGRVAAYDPGGRFLQAVTLPARHVTCPAFGGPDHATLYVTSALQGVSAEVIAQVPDQGKTFCISGLTKGLPEPRVIL